MRKHLAALCFIALACPAHAEMTPGASSLDHRVRITRYVDGQVYQIKVSMMKVTSVEFGRDEEIRSIVAGDTEGFDFDAVPGGKVMVIKPKIAGIATNITVYTNKRSYYFSVKETKRAPYYVVRFSHPDSNSKTPTKVVTKLPPYSHYGADKLTLITPIQIWDDGTFTYFRFKKNTSVPAIFRISNGRERTTNSTAQSDGLIRVSGVSKYWVLRAGDVENTVARRAAP